jgi:hypothetical protein
MDWRNHLGGDGDIEIELNIQRNPQISDDDDYYHESLIDLGGDEEYEREDEEEDQMFEIVQNTRGYDEESDDILVIDPRKGTQEWEIEREEDSEDILFLPTEEKEKEEEQKDCLCSPHRKDLDDSLMVECDKCKVWYHALCVGLNEAQLEILENQLYACPPCRQVFFFFFFLSSSPLLSLFHSLSPSQLPPLLRLPPLFLFQSFTSPSCDFTFASLTFFVPSTAGEKIRKNIKRSSSDEEEEEDKREEEEEEVMKMMMKKKKTTTKKKKTKKRGRRANNFLNQMTFLISMSFIKDLPLLLLLPFPLLLNHKEEEKEKEEIPLHLFLHLPYQCSFLLLPFAIEMTLVEQEVSLLLSA